MSTKLKTIAEFNRPVELSIHQTDGKEMELRLGGAVIASAEQVWDAERWLISIQEEDAEGFYVTNRGEALDALSDIGIFYKLLKEGHL